VIGIEHLPADTLGLGTLARDALASRIHVTGVPLPRSIAAFPRPEDRHEPRERASLAERLELALAPYEPPVAALDAVRSLAQPDAFCVVTGQQPGFLCSPLFSLYKALQAVRLAEALRATWGVPVVPLFWNHGDDHDIAEVHHTYVVNRNLDLQKVALAGMSSGRMPVSRLVLERETNRLDSIRSFLAQNFGGRAHLDDALELLMPREGESLAHAFTRAFTELLGHLGLVIIEPDWIREGMSNALAHIVGRDPRPALKRGAEELRALGYEPPIDPAEAALVYHHDDKGRQPLRAGGEGFRYDGEPGSRTPAELAAEIVQSKADWSPGALLRPLVQDLVLPTCAYIGGFGELAYQLTLGHARDVAGAPRTPFVPRVSCTLVEHETRVSLDKLGVTLKDALAGGASPVHDAQAGQGEHAAVPPVADELRRIARSAADQILSLRPELRELDASLPVNAKRTADQLRSFVDKLADKAERVRRNRAGKGQRHERRMTNALRPRGLPQERVLGPLPFLARYGRAWIDELARELDPLAPEHLAVHLETPDTIDPNYPNDIRPPDPENTGEPPPREAP